jgi:hypothetical protein
VLFDVAAAKAQRTVLAGHESKETLNSVLLCIFFQEGFSAPLVCAAYHLILAAALVLRDVQER